VLPGNKNPDKYFVICAHFDLISESPEKAAPRADDNGGGVAALLELVRIIKNYDMSNTIRIVFFSNKERGYHGSRSYVKHLKSLSEYNIAGIIVDTIGYRNCNKTWILRLFQNMSG